MIPRRVPPAGGAAMIKGERLSGELWGGLAAMLVALPSAIAYGVASFVPLGGEYVADGALAGILGALALGIVAPLAGGAPRLISAPCAPAAAVLASLTTALLAGAPGFAGPLPPERVVVLLTAAAAMSALLQLLYGAVGGGRLIKYIPYPVVAGYLSGVALLILLGQLPKLFGLPEGAHGWRALADPSLWRWQGLAVGLATIAGMAGARRITTALPAPVLGLAAGVAVYFGCSLASPELLRFQDNPLIIGPVAQGGGSLARLLVARWQGLAGMGWADLQALLVPALTLSALLSIDTLKTCVVVDAITRSRHDSNRELIGQGLGNLAAALAGGMPGAGTMGATLVNVNSGGTTRLSGVSEGLFVLAAFLLFSPLIGWVPLAALAGILVVVAVRMFDRASFHLLRQRSTVLDFLVIAAVVAAAVEFNLVVAAGVGLGLAILLFIREQMRSSVIRRKLYGDQLSSRKQRLPEERELLQTAARATAICELQGNLFFGTTDRLFSELEPDLRASRFVILDMRRVQGVDFTAAHMLEQLGARLGASGAELIFSSLPAQLPTGQDLEAYFRQLGVVRAATNVRVFDTLNDALEWTEEQLLAAAQGRPGEDGLALELAAFDLLREFEADQTLGALSACVEERRAAAGETIFHRGEAGDELFLVRRGEVRIAVPFESGKQLILTVCGRGHIFGDMAFLDRRPRSADAIALTEVELYAIPRSRFDAVIRAHPVVGVKVFARLAGILALRLRHADAELRALLEA